MSRVSLAVTGLVAALGAFAHTSIWAAECDVTVDSTDRMSFSTQSIQVSKSCPTFTVHLTHSGSLPKQVMGHNLVISKAADQSSISADGIAAGIAHDYLKPDDSRVIAHTDLIGAGEQSALTLEVSKLDSATAYKFFCSFPGHASVMVGDLTLID